MLKHIEIKTDFGTVRIFEGMETGLRILVDPLSKDNFQDIHINCVNGGIPGVVGPDVDFCLGEVLDEITESCREKAFDQTVLENSVNAQHTKKT
jgi:hypothetical protein